MQSAAVCIIFMSASVSGHFLQMNQKLKVLSTDIQRETSQCSLSAGDVCTPKQLHSLEYLDAALAQLVKNFSPFVKPEYLSPCSQHPLLHPVHNVPTASSSKRPHCTLFTMSLLHPVSSIPLQYLSVRPSIHPQVTTRLLLKKLS